MSDESTRDEVLLANRALLVLHSSRTAAHELNNVFQMIGGAAELLLANPSLPPALVARVEGLVRHVRRGETIVRGVSDLARPEGPGAMTLELAEITNQALEMRRFEHRRAGLTVNSELADGILVRADARDLIQILLNAIILAERAAAGRTDGAITVTAQRQGDIAAVTVADNGADAESAALDLAAARLLAEAAGGNLERSGSQTWLRLPLVNSGQPR